MSLTDTAVRKAAPRAKPYKLADGGGMYLEVMPTGAKYWRIKYRHGGKEKRLALGVYDRVTLAAARNRREDAHRLLADGVDLGAARKQAKQVAAEAVAVAVDTFEAVAREWMARQEVAEVTANKSRWILETFLFPEIGSRPIAEITARELLGALRKIEETGKLETAKRAKIKAGQVFRYAVLEGKAASDPTTTLRKALKAPKGKHHAAITDPAKMGGLLRAIDGFTGQYVTLAALKLAPLVFVRPGELRQAEWAEFDLDGAIWRIPGERMKMKAAHLVPLSAQALAILRELYPLTGVARFVFPGLRTGNPPHVRKHRQRCIAAARLHRRRNDRARLPQHGGDASKRNGLERRCYRAPACPRRKQQGTRRLHSRRAISGRTHPHDAGMGGLSGRPARWWRRCAVQAQSELSVFISWRSF